MIRVKCGSGKALRREEREGREKVPQSTFLAAFPTQEEEEAVVVRPGLQRATNERTNASAAIGWGEGRGRGTARKLGGSESVQHCGLWKKGKKRGGGETAQGKNGTGK